MILINLKCNFNGIGKNDKKIMNILIEKDLISKEEKINWRFQRKNLKKSNSNNKRGSRKNLKK